MEEIIREDPNQSVNQSRELFHSTITVTKDIGA